MIYYQLSNCTVCSRLGFGFYNRRSFQGGGKRYRDPEEWKIIENAHPAIITLEEADAIYVLNQRRKAESVFAFRRDDGLQQLWITTGRKNQGRNRLLPLWQLSLSPR